jgi:manganese/iron transport system permease protein
LISTSRNFSRDLASFLFGNVLGVTESDILLSLGAGCLVLALLLVFYRELLIVSFDRLAAEAMGIRTFWFDLLLLLLITLTIVVSLRAVGNILVVAMLVTPAATARQLTDRLPLMIGLSSLLGAASGAAGLLISFHHDLAAGGTIVLVATAVFLAVWLLAPQHGVVTSLLQRRRMALGGLEPESGVLFESLELRRPGR